MLCFIYENNGRRLIVNKLKEFKNWLEEISIKQTIVLTGIGITLFIAMQQAFVGSLATGGASDIYAMAFFLWFTVALVTFVLATFLLFIGYSISKIKSKIIKRKK